ncbi:uncharacterized protein IL334_004819 [Kwoniella shivajii]|uniref:Rad60/SUMO-like domain-containing protein n=1 Tax=Kwoniella shivajii TaxID=564305 RepID=A0ABZ1D1S3_9TREE|nr:hypothetical protein IL334_004819 [Kwoniella shivajii]
MSGCFSGESFVEQVHLFLIEYRDNGNYTYRHSWDGCISSYSPLRLIFDRWAQEEHCGEPFEHFHFRLRDPTEGRTLVGDESSRDLRIHSGTRIYIARVITGEQ